MPGHQRRAVPPAESSWPGRRGDFTCVGDDDQSIYAWRGANPENLRQLAQDYPALKVIKLEQNYRCSNRVLRAANTLIANNPHEHPKTAVERAGRRRAHPRVGMPRQRARGRDASPPRSTTCTRRKRCAVERVLHPVPRQPPVAAAGKGAAAAAHALPPERRHRVPRTPGSEGRAVLAARCWPIPTTTRPSCARCSRRKREVGATTLAKLAELAAARAPADVARGRIDRRCSSS